MNTRHVVAATLTVALLSSGCAAEADDTAVATQELSSAEAPSSVASPTASPTPWYVDPDDPANIVTTDPDGPYLGKWHAVLTDKRATQMGDTDSEYLGQFRLELNGDGTYTTFQERDGRETRGQYAAASGHRLVFSQDDGCDGQFEGMGVYRWQVRNDTMTIKNVVPETGGCTGRTDSLTLPVWRRR